MNSALSAVELEQVVDAIMPYLSDNDKRVFPCRVFSASSTYAAAQAITTLYN